MSTDAYRLITSINLDRHGVLVVGGGTTGERKIRTLLDAGASVTLISPEATAELCEAAQEGKITWLRRGAEACDFRDFSFAMLAVGRDEAAALAMIARENGCLVDFCADGAQGDFALCAQFKQDGCYIGVSSGGKDPARAAAVKRGLRVHTRAPRVLLARKSPLALAQANYWRDALEGAGVPVEIRTMSTHGDRDKKRDLAAFGGFGAFVKALEEDLLAGRGDGAVHSLKDMPVNLPEGCRLAGVLERGSASDMFIARESGVTSLEELPLGAKVGTSSARRRAQVRGVRRDLETVTCRGNVGTRLAKLASGEIDALILAEAGLERLGLVPPNAVRLPFVTAAGQGAVALELSESQEDAPLMEAVRQVTHLPTWYEATAERELLRLMGLGCTCPVAVRAEWCGGVLTMTAAIYSIDPKGDPEDEQAQVMTGGTVSSDGEARAVAERLWWNHLYELPLLRELQREAGVASCL